MKTLSAAAMGLSGARAAYKAYSNYKNETKNKAYDALSSAAENYGPKAEDAMEQARDKYDESMKKAGEVTKAARARLEKAIAAAEEKGDSALPELRSKNKKLSRKVRRQAAKQEKKLNKNDKDSHWVRNLALLALTASGVAALAYALMNKDKNTPGTTPPRVQDEEQTPVQEAVDGDDAAAADEPVLVYSTETGDDAAAEVPADDAVENLASELEADAAGDADLAADAADVAEPTADAADETPEAVDALLEDLSDAETIQAEADAVQAEYDAKNAPQREQSDKDK